MHQIFGWRPHPSWGRKKLGFLDASKKGVNGRKLRHKRRYNFLFV
jgi:hypothetical protein